MVKDNFVPQLVQSEEIFQNIPEWAQFSQGHREKGRKPGNIELKNFLENVFLMPTYLCFHL